MRRKKRQPNYLTAVDPVRKAAEARARPMESDLPSVLSGLVKRDLMLAQHLREDHKGIKDITHNSQLDP